MARDFIHLHVHTQYSLLDGQAGIQRLVDKAIGDGMRGMAVTDHGNMMVVKEYFNICNKVNKERKAAGQEPFVPIFGCEMYVVEGDATDEKQRSREERRYHLIVLAKNMTGYKNLIKLVSKAWTEGFYNRPRTDHKQLEERHEGLIVCSACIAGEVPHYILDGKLEKAEETIEWYKRVFGEDYYLELQRHEVKNPMQRANRDTYPLQQEANAKIIELAKKHGVKYICSNDVHFVDEENAEAHDRLICLSTGRDLDDPKRMLYTKQEWFKTRAEMEEIFSDVPEAMDATMEILGKIETYSIDHGPIMPNFDIPEEFGTEEEYRKKFTDEDLFQEFTRDENGNEVISREEGEKKVARLGGVDKLYRLKLEADYLAHLAYKGAKPLYGDPLPEEVRERMNFELYIMKTMGFPGYFLIVQDYISAARNELGVSVGPGRGSAAGSAVAYCLGITQVDPIKYDLLFERFLNPDRISLPDIDVDFDDDGRGRVLDWVTKKYGAEKVAHIITYGTMATKLAIKDVARVQKVPLDVSNAICKAIPDRLPDGPDGKATKMNLANAIKYVPELQSAASSPDPLLANTIKYARMLEGNVRNTGIHACGVIICRDDVTDWVPVSTADDKETGGKCICTQYEGSVIEDTGLIKMDFLGLKTLSIIKETLKNIKDSLGIDVDIDHVPIDDPKTYQLYSEGKTVGTFQFESAGMQKYLRELHPSTFEDLIAMNALYRPGPMDYIPDFIDRKLGRKPVTYDIPCMERYLKDTYGVTVYQEQVMLLSRQLAGFTRGQSDTLRKAMGKKMIDKMNHLEGLFYEGGEKNGHPKEVLQKIWEDWKKFASYAFNKSHATCYSWVAYQTAYLKANYPPQYMAATMSRSKDTITDITKLMAECKAMGIETLGPDVNSSRMLFSVDVKGNVRFGLAAVKGLGESAVEAIISEREKNGEFKSIYDFVQRVNLSAVKRNGMECLAKSGAFDCFEGVSREQFFVPTEKGGTWADTLIRFGTQYQADKAANENSLFGLMDEMVEVTPPPMPAFTAWSSLVRLNEERKLVGIYLSAHPLDDYAVILRHICNVKLEMLDNLPPLLNRDLMIGGMVTGVKRGTTKKGTPYGIVTMEDYDGAHEVPLFGDAWAKWANYMEEGNTILLYGRVQPKKWKPEEVELYITKVEFLSDVKDKLVTSLVINVAVEDFDEELLSTIQAHAEKHPGKASLGFTLLDLKSHRAMPLVSRNTRISVTKGLCEYLDGKDGVTYKVS